LGNCLIAYGNRVDAGTLSGGSWLPTLPLTNLQNELIGVKARSTNCDLVSTQFVADVGPFNASRACALIGHNLSIDAMIRVRASEDDLTFADTAFDTGWQQVWPAVYEDGVLIWGVSNFWERQYSDEEREGYTADFFAVAPTSILARYWLVEINDIGNLDNHVDIGRLFIGDGFEPTINMEFGAGIGWEDGSVIDEAISGAEFFDRRAVYRVVKFTIPMLPEAEALTYAFEIMRRSGSTREVLFQWDTEDTLHALRRQFMGRLRALSAVENVNVDAHSSVWEIKEQPG
jgi:hypothetical protein